MSLTAANMKEPPCFIHHHEAAEFTMTPIHRRRRDQARGLTHDEMIGILDTRVCRRPRECFSPQNTQCSIMQEPSRVYDYETKNSRM